MSMTQAARSGLNAFIVSHDGQSDGTVTSTGLIKTRNGLVIPPSGIGGGTDTRTGALAELTTSEKQAYHMDELHSAAPRQVPASAVAKRRTGKQGRGSRNAPAPAPQEPRAVLVQFRIPDVGMVPSQYVHFYRGDNMIVLGMNEFSYTPPKASVRDGNLVGVVELPDIPGARYIYSGHAFTDNEGIRNIVLLRVPERPRELPQEEQEDDYGNDQELE